MNRLLAPGRAVILHADATQEASDRYDRALRYVEIAGAGRNVGLVQVSRGPAEVYAFDGALRRLDRYRDAAGAIATGTAEASRRYARGSTVEPGIGAPPPRRP